MTTKPIQDETPIYDELVKKHGDPRRHYAPSKLVAKTGKKAPRS